MQLVDILRIRLDRTYFTEIENWKYCSKIIFKCVNSTVKPIFNKKVAEKWDLWVPCTVHRTHWCAEKGWKVKWCSYCSWTIAVCLLKCVPKKIKGKRKTQNTRCQTCIQTHTGKIYDGDKKVWRSFLKLLYIEIFFQVALLMKTLWKLLLLHTERTFEEVLYAKLA